MITRAEVEKLGGRAWRGAATVLSRVPLVQCALVQRALVQRGRPYLAAALISIFLTGSFFSVCRPAEIVRMPSW